MPKSTLTGRDEAHEMLLQSTRRFQQGSKIVPARYQVISLNQILDYLLINWADHKGNAAIAYGSIGDSIAITAGFDFGIFICPGVANVSLNATGKLKKTDDAFFLIHRSMPERWVSHQGRLQEHKKVKSGMFVDEPVCFMAMEGYSREWSVKIAIAASISSSSIGIPLGAFGFTLGGAEISGEISRTIYYFHDRHPGWYKNSRSELLLKDFSDSLGARTTHYLKREIVNWLNFIREDLKVFLSAPLNQGLRIELEQLPKFRFTNPSQKTITKKLKDLLTTINNIWVSTNTQKALREQTEKYIKELEEAQKANGAYRIKSKKGRKKGNPGVKHLCQITLVNWKTEGKIKASIGTNPVDGAMGGGSGIGKSFAGDPNVSSFANDRLSAASTLSIPTFTLGAGIEFTYKRVSTNYRYQSYAYKRNETRVVYTQDVKILYTEMDITAAVQAGIDVLVGRDIDLSGVHIKGKDLSGLNKVKSSLLAGKSLWGKRSMYYRAVNAYWNFSSNNTSKQRATYNGSGISFGISVRMQDLLRIAIVGNGSHSDSFMEKELGEYARLLKVTVKEFTAFLKSFLIGDDELDYKNELTGFERCMEYGAVLVESNFRFTNSMNIPMKIKKDRTFSKTLPEDLTKNPQWKNFLEKDSIDRKTVGLQLEAMRIRLRLGDHTSSSKNIFRLGIYLFGSGFGFNWDKVKASGNEGILDLHIHHFIEFDQNIKRYAQTLRDGVPPVMLIPHHFNE